MMLDIGMLMFDLESTEKYLYKKSIKDEDQRIATDVEIHTCGSKE
jgi:hypothetical protein